MATQSHSLITTNTSPWYFKQLRNFGAASMVTLLTALILTIFLAPFAYSMVTSVKDKEQIFASAKGTILPVDAIVYNYEGKDYDVYLVPLEGGTKELALFKPGRKESTFIDPANPDAEPIVWEGAWRTLQPVEKFSPRLNNFGDAWNRVNFPRLMRNTAIIAALGVIGTLLSSICVAYAFARFPLPGKNILFLILIGTIILPSQVTLVPTYTFFARIGWTGSDDGIPWGWLPLIVPHFFANAYNVFLIRQYFLTLPRELDEAAMIDGAGPLRILRSVIIPQSWPVIVAVALFHTVFAWNDYFLPLLYTLGATDFQPLSVGIQVFNFLYAQEPHLIQATAIMGLLLPVLLFFLAQRFFMRGVVVTGVEK